MNLTFRILSIGLLSFSKYPEEIGVQGGLAIDLSNFP